MAATISVRVLGVPLLAVALLTPTGGSRVAAADIAPVTASDCWSTDNGDPDVTGLSLSSTTVDVSGGDATVHVEAAVVDTGGPGPASGIQSVVVSAVPVSRTPPTLRAAVRLRAASAETWAGDLVIRRGFTPGLWTIQGLDVLDGAQHQRQYGTRDLLAMGAASTFTVVGPADQQRPVLEALSVTPTRVDGDRFPVRVTVRATARDDLAGVQELRVSAQHGEGGKIRRARLHLVTSGRGAAPGSWVGNLTLGHRRDAGAWLLRADLFDWLGRHVIVGAGGLHSLGLPNKITVRAVDPRSPLLLAARRTPATVDVRSHDGVLGVRVRAADPVSGVERVRVILYPRSVRPFDFPSSQLARVAGSARDGVWRGKVVIPRCAANLAAYRVRVQMRDLSGNQRSTMLPDIRVLAAPDRVRPVVDDVALYGAPPTGPLIVAFDEDVTGVTDSTALVRPAGYYRIYAPEPPQPIPGSWACRDPQGAETSCSTGRVRTAAFTPTAPMAPQTDYALEINPEHTLGVVDMAGNPAASFPLQFRTGAATN
jgi:hypothetical protein